MISRSVRFGSNLDVVDGCDQAIISEHTCYVRMIREPLAPIVREVVHQNHGRLVVLDVLAGALIISRGEDPTRI